MSEQLVFTEEEWAEMCPRLTVAMQEFLRPYRTLVIEHLGDHGQGWGSGSYLKLGDRRFVLTNEHVATARRQGRKLAHMFNGNSNVYQVIGNHVDVTWPTDLALLPISVEAWQAQGHTSQAIEVDQIAPKHAPVPGELLAFTGFAGERVKFVFGELFTEGTCYVAREVPLPIHEEIDPTVHFGIEYRPDLVTSINGTPGLPVPKGFSGSTVWNTGVVAAKMNGVEWTPDMSRVTGVIWGWPSSDACIVATRAEHLHAFLGVAVSHL